MLLSAAAPNPFLAEARVHFQAQDFQRCLKRLDQAASWKSTTTEEAEVSLYRGLCRFGGGEETAAAGDFEHALRIDAAVALPAWTSPRLREAFEATRARLGLTATTTTTTNTATTALTNVTPSPATPTVSSTASAEPRRLAAWPGVATLAAASVALGLGIGFGAHARGLETASFGARFESDARAAALGARDFATAANASFAVAAAAAVASGILLLVQLLGAP
jgi:hypothetical protein